MSSRRIFLHPGFVRSATDGDRHWIGSRQLADLYGVPFRDCLVVDDELGLTVGPSGFPMPRGYRERPDDLHLAPRRDGNYSLERAQLEQAPVVDDEVGA